MLDDKESRDILYVRGIMSGSSQNVSCGQELIGAMVVIVVLWFGWCVELLGKSSPNSGPSKF